MTQLIANAEIEDFLARLPEALRTHIQRDVSLAKHCSYRVGGLAQLWFEPQRDDDLLLVLQAARQCKIPCFVLGNGSNVIPPDETVAGLLIHFSQNYARISQVSETLIEVQAGAMLAQVSQYALHLKRRGLEWMVDIPASLGGAVLMNAGNNEGTMAQLVASVRFIDADLHMQTLPQSELVYGYRQSRFKNSRDMIVSAQLKLGPLDEPENIKQRMRAQREMRRDKFPMHFGNAGSVFKRPPGDYAGRLIEASGLKGLQVGDAQVSEKHAGFIVNLGHATAKDIALLIQKVQQRVFADSGIKLEREQIFFAWDGME